MYRPIHRVKKLGWNRIVLKLLLMIIIYDIFGVTHYAAKCHKLHSKF